MAPHKNSSMNSSSVSKSGPDRYNSNSSNGNKDVKERNKGECKNNEINFNSIGNQQKSYLQSVYHFGWP